ncbi:unnamed protein product [Microthlaspi erraticum]|uniref:Uncharacterized protein n=1 Tax=Microthlaspi erraticum TaxID=1685480 RepID=A0A6D2IU82_9BRAS|nr:unnamed protein product [Microthlaspi erraticum]
MYLDVMVEGERVLMDIDFKMKFEIAPPTKISVTLSYVFVGKVDWLKRIVAVFSKAAKKILKKKGLLFRCWHAKYVLAKWLPPYVCANQGETRDHDVNA